MLYVFSGYPKCGLNAGGLQRCVEEVENLGILEHDPAVQYAREGVFVVHGSVGERIGKLEYRLSALLERQGITMDWFYQNWAFGNGVTTHKSRAMRETMLVDHQSGVEIGDLLVLGAAPLDLSKLRIQRVPKRTEGWTKYESRWLPGTCPQESHLVHLTWLVLKHRLPEFIYLRLEQIIESPSVILRDIGRYQARHFSKERKWEGPAEIPAKEREMGMRQLLSLGGGHA